MERIPHPTTNPNELNRKKMRWDGYDYTRSGIYYVTFCTYNRVCYLGEIVDGEMKYSNAGSLAEAFLSVLHVFNPKVEVLSYVVMPDHIHALIYLSNDEADLRWFEQCQHISEDTVIVSKKDSLSTIISNYKAAVTRCCNRQHIDFKWQRGFFDHVVRNSEELEALKTYIHHNPGNWEADRNMNPLTWPL